MKRAILPAALLALLLAVPALSQGDGDAGKLEELGQVVADQQQRIEKLEAEAKANRAEAKKLLGALLAAEQGGFLFPAPNTDARKSLLKGLQRFATVASGGKPAPAEDE